MQWKNNLTRLLSIEYPVIQAPMLGVSTPEMAAAVSNQGGLGSLPVGGLSPQRTTELIQQTKQLTNKPFAVNLFAHSIPAIDQSTAEAMQAYLETVCLANQIPYTKLALNDLHFYSYKDQIDVLIQEKIPIVSFTFGILDDESIQSLKAAGCLLNGTATSVKEAELLTEKDIDIISVQGIEAGGHRGTFLTDDPLPMVGLMSLLPLIADRVSKPLLAAGGIHNGQTIKAAFDLGASGVQVGTAFIASPESVAIPAYKERLQRSSETDSVLTRSFSGRWARGISNTFMREIDKSGLSIPEYPIQNSLTTALRVAAQRQNNAEFTNMWAGQLASASEAKPAADIFRKLIAQTEALF
ncbi:NAD(P)H-dependent flavin oxidoreductase [Spirosoma endbachense]|uniref:Nitronate monooxygenase n=1 Tax=Spirosoma endbachense TaxID=2666025 RepID=A0A6P1W4H5_9BACT|nr:nitronate monooxygenase family protein [Spirosoma endbachense]QHV98907.1 nitronate monooxygenase [Spirosoma endbachense]